MTNSNAKLDRILLPLDGSEAAASIVTYVERLATMVGAGVTLLGVVPPPPDDLPADPYGGADIGVITQYLEGMKRRLEENGISADEEVQEGQAPTVILACAAGRRCGIIALSTRGRSATGPNLLGITTDMLIRSSSVPIVVIPPDGNGGSVSPVGGVKTIIVGLDGSETDDDRSGWRVSWPVISGSKCCWSVRPLRSIHWTELPPTLGLCRTTPRSTSNALQTSLLETGLQCERWSGR